MRAHAGLTLSLRDGLGCVWLAGLPAVPSHQPKFASRVHHFAGSRVTVVSIAYIVSSLPGPWLGQHKPLSWFERLIRHLVDGMYRRCERWMHGVRLTRSCRRALREF